MNIFLVNIILAVAWVVITVNYSLLNVVFGFVLGTASLYVVRSQFEGTESYFRRAGRIMRFVLVFLYELLMSGVKVAIAVCQPASSWKPGIIAIPLSTRDPIEIMILANAVTLTPGTLSVDVSADQSILYVHAIDASDPDDLRIGTKRTFERKIMDALL